MAIVFENIDELQLFLIKRFMNEKLLIILVRVIMNHDLSLYSKMKILPNSNIK